MEKTDLIFLLMEQNVAAEKSRSAIMWARYGRGGCQRGQILILIVFVTKNRPEYPL